MAKLPDCLVDYVEYIGVTRQARVRQLSWLQDREMGLRQPCSARSRSEAVIGTSLLPHIRLVRLVNVCSGSQTQGRAVFNLEFSPDGKMLLAACEEKQFKVYDPLNGSHISTVHKAHMDSVNYIKFLDDRVFATCSDDHTVALWDVRKLSYSINRLHGHSGWVKNVEYLTDKGLLLSSALDGSVFVWDINRYSETSTCWYQQILKVPGLLRTALSPDETKLILTTKTGYLILVKDLCVDNIATDLAHVDLTREAMFPTQGDLPEHCYNDATHRPPLGANSTGAEAGSIRPSSAPLARTDSDTSERGSRRRRNRVEVVTDFYPQKYKDWCISSVAVHPHAWCLMSRYTRAGDTIQGTEDPIRADSSESAEPTSRPSAGESRGPSSPSPGSDGTGRLTHFIEEANVGRGYIKEICFSNDGRLICSPFGYGVRLLAFDDKCQELCDCPPMKTPKELVELKTNVCHPKPVVTTKFSPTHCLIATGCLGGHLAIHEPWLSSQTCTLRHDV